MSLEWQKKKHRNKRYTIQNAQFQLILRNGLSCCCFYFLFFPSRMLYPSRSSQAHTTLTSMDCTNKNSTVESFIVEVKHLRRNRHRNDSKLSADEESMC